jgi:ribosomal protein L7/L12
MARNCSSCAHANPDGVERCVECGTLLDAPDSPSSLEAELKPLVQAGRLIEAIKLHRERTGAGLKESKDAIDALAAGGRLPPPPAPLPGQGDPEQELLALLREGRRIEAVKRYRERTGAGLKESMDAVARLGAREGIKVPAKGCLALVAGLFLFR